MQPIKSLRQAERDALLARLYAALEADPRVAAAWLWGSLGRGDGDAWSDLDRWVAFYDGAYDDERRHDFATGSCFTVEAPQNAPAGGAYLMSAHDAPTGPHLVDWYFQPLRFVAEDRGRTLLFAREALPPSPDAAPPAVLRSVTPEADAAKKAGLFWAMALIQAKHVARKLVEEGLGFEGFLLHLLGVVAVWRGTPLDERETPGLRLAGEKLERLRGLGRTMAAVAPEFAGPREAVDRFLATVAQAIHEAS